MTALAWVDGALPLLLVGKVLQFGDAARMTSLERVLTTLKFGEPDRVPFFEQGVASNVASALLGRRAETGGGAFRYKGVLAAIAGPDAYREYENTYFNDWCDLMDALAFDVVTLPWAGGGVPTRRIDEQTFFFGDNDGAWHVMRLDPPSDTFHMIDSSLRHENGLVQIEREIAWMRHLHATRQRPVPEEFGLLERLIARYKGKCAVAAGPCLGVPMEMAWLEFMMVRPELVEEYTRMQADFICDQVDVLADMGVHILWGGGDFCTNKGPVYSPAQFRRFMLKPLCQITKRCHERDMPYIFRTDGVIWPVAQELFVKSGVDGYGEIDKQAGMDLADIRRRLPHLILWGNVDCGQTLTSGTREEVADETCECIDAAACGGGYMLGSSNVIHAAVPVENFLAMVETSRVL
jgi:uroporphyrinogen decarboxylase